MAVNVAAILDQVRALMGAQAQAQTILSEVSGRKWKSGAHDDVDKLQRLLDQLEQATNGLTAAQKQAETELAQVRETIAEQRLDAQLAGDETAVDDERQLRAQVHLEAITGALRKAAERRIELQAKLCRAQAKEARELAAELRAEADKRQRITDGLLARLKEHEGCDFGPRFAFSPIGVVVDPGGQLAGGFPETRTAMMRREAEAAAGRALALEDAAARLTATG